MDARIELVQGVTRGWPTAHSPCVGRYTKVEAVRRTADLTASHCVRGQGHRNHHLIVYPTFLLADALLAVNTVGPIKLTRALLPGLLGQKRPARIVVVASMAAKVPSPGQSIYSGERLHMHINAQPPSLALRLWCCVGKGAEHLQEPVAKVCECCDGLGKDAAIPRHLPCMKGPPMINELSH
eukprot:1160009-Pelagomonas_calceolata.AAC.2